MFESAIDALSYLTLLKLRGVIRTDVCRAPHRPLTDEEKQKLADIYAAYCAEEGIHGER